jgi:hypothetical protein
MAVPKSILSFPDTFNTFHFIRTGITNFLINYKDMYKDYNIKEKERVRRYSRYYIKHITVIIRGFVSFLEPN